MPIDPTMCSLCFHTVYEGEHWTDDTGQKWDCHSWCHLMDIAAARRMHAGRIRKAKGIPTPEDEDREEREFFERQEKA